MVNWRWIYYYIPISHCQKWRLTERYSDANKALFLYACFFFVYTSSCCIQSSCEFFGVARLREYLLSEKKKQKNQANITEWIF